MPTPATFTPDIATVQFHPVTVKPSPNRSARPTGIRVRCIVLHSTGSNEFGGSVSWLCNPDSEVSAHYAVSREGQIVQLVPLCMNAWHAGKSAWKGEQINGSINAFSIGIEMEHVDGQGDWPRVQVAAVAALVDLVLERESLAIDAVVGHADICLPKKRKVDPRDFPWEAFRALVASRGKAEPALVLPGGRVGGRIIESTLYVPARAVCEAVGLTSLTWDGVKLELTAGK